MQYNSPLRYPGGKSALAGFLSYVIELNDLSACSYYEPFAGGAGAALALLKAGIVSNIHLNDADPRIYSFWKSVLRDPDELANRIFNAKLTISEWEKQRDICRRFKQHRQMDIGFAAFFMNRCNRSGILLGAGPIGGRAQSGKWRMDVRFNKDDLAARILQMARFKSAITFDNYDALEFLKNRLPRGNQRGEVFVYLDPPYYEKGSKLYLNSYQDRDHKNLASYMTSQKILRWVMSYDYVPHIMNLYKSCTQRKLSLKYSLQEKRDANELFITPHRIVLPMIMRENDEVTISCGDHSLQKRRIA